MSIYVSNLAYEVEEDDRGADIFRTWIGKAQETVGNVTGDRETQIKGKVNQAEGDIRAVP